MLARDPKWVRLLSLHDLAGGELAWPEVMAFDAALWLLQKGVRMHSARAWPFPAGSCCPGTFGHSAFRNLDMPYATETHDLEFSVVIVNRDFVLMTTFRTALFGSFYSRNS